ALSLCFDACRCPRTAAHFWATCISVLAERFLPLLKKVVACGGRWVAGWQQRNYKPLRLSAPIV
ncbi:hypothetical protein, partial [Mesorhizobium humile]